MLTSACNQLVCIAVSELTIVSMKDMINVNTKLKINGNNLAILVKIIFIGFHIYAC